jgi:hypothetical protein
VIESTTIQFCEFSPWRIPFTGGITSVGVGSRTGSSSGVAAGAAGQSSIVLTRLLGHFDVVQVGRHFEALLTQFGR